MKIWVPRTFYGKAAAVEGWGCIFTLNPNSRLRGRCMLAGFPQGPLHALGDFLRGHCMLSGSPQSRGLPTASQSACFVPLPH